MTRAPLLVGALLLSAAASACGAEDERESPDKPPSPVFVDPEAEVSRDPDMERSDECYRRDGRLIHPPASIPVRRALTRLPAGELVALPMRNTGLSGKHQLHVARITPRDGGFEVEVSATLTADREDEVRDVKAEIALGPEGEPEPPDDVDGEPPLRVLDPRHSARLGSALAVDARLSEERDEVGCPIPRIAVGRVRQAVEIRPDEWVAVWRGQSARLGERTISVGEIVNVDTIEGCYSESPITVEDGEGSVTEASVTGEGVTRAGDLLIHVKSGELDWALLKVETAAAE